LVMGCEVLVGSAGLTILVTGVCLGLAVTLGPDFAVLPLTLVFVSTGDLGITGTGSGWGGYVLGEP
jgi:hypothetical protein